jgi:glycosyltransferase involved in cell wall biosynthesis
VVFGGAAQAAGVKVALWEHGFQTKANWLERMARRLRPDYVIANSHFTAAMSRNRFPHAPVRILYYPVALEEAPQRDQWRAAIRREQAVDDDTTVILQVSRMEAWKGHVLHLEALSRLKTAGKWVCWIAGGPQKANEEQYFRELQQRANQLGIAERVRFLGQRADVPKLLAAADVFCQPNQGPEPFGIVFIEALWAGRPVVATAMGGALEIIDESCGFLAKPADPDSLAQALHNLIESPDLRRRLGRSGPLRARLLCDPASRMQDLKEIPQPAIDGEVRL